jgi:hypothetical protein
MGQIEKAKTHAEDLKMRVKKNKEIPIQDLPMYTYIKKGLAISS